MPNLKDEVATRAPKLEHVSYLKTDVRVGLDLVFVQKGSMSTEKGKSEHKILTFMSQRKYSRHKK